MTSDPLAPPLHDAECTDGRPVVSPLGKKKTLVDFGGVHAMMQVASAHSLSSQSMKPSRSLSWKSKHASLGTQLLATMPQNSLQKNVPLPSPRLWQVAPPKSLPSHCS